MKSNLCIIAITILMSGCVTSGAFPVCDWQEVSPSDLALYCKDKDPKLNACQGGNETCIIYVRKDLRRPDQVMCSPEGKVVDRKADAVSTPVPASRLAPGSICAGGKACD